MATDAEVDEAVTAELRRHGELTDADRPAATGDFVTLDLAATRDGEEVAGLNTEDWSYEIGQGWVADDFDEQLDRRRRPATSCAFTTTPKGTAEPADFVVTVDGGAGARRCPRLTDEWVADNIGEFDTVEEWRASIRERISRAASSTRPARSSSAGSPRRSPGSTDDRAAGVDGAERSAAARRGRPCASSRPRASSMDQWLSATGQDASGFVEGMKGASEQAVKVDLALRAVAEAEELDADDGDLDAEYERMAMQFGQKPNQVRKAYEQNDPVPELVAQIRKSKALDWLIHHVEMVDPDGNAARARPRSSATATTHARRPRPRPRRTTTSTITTPESARTLHHEPPGTTSSPTSSSRPAAASGPTTSTAGCSRRTSSSCRRRSTTRSPA